MQRALEEAIGVLAPRLSEAVRAFCVRSADVTEIRLRRGLPLSLSTFHGNRFLDAAGCAVPLSSALCARKEEILYTVDHLCEGSVYRHIDTLRLGYLTMPCGVRAGVCGGVLYGEEGRVRIDPSGFCGVNLRIPRLVSGAAGELCRYYRKHGICSTLIYSAPGVGKTTLVRDLSLQLSRGVLGKPLRVAVIDERRELFPEAENFRGGAGLLDVLSGYPKATGMEIATRLFSPDVLLCDEIGGAFDPDALLEAQHSGVLFVATVHADKMESLLEKPRLRRLLDHKLFSLVCGLSRADETENTLLRFSFSTL